MRCMARCLFSISLCAAIALVACSQLKSSQKPVVAGTSTLKNRIPPANPSKYRSIVDASDWQNPYLVVSANGIYALPISPAIRGRNDGPCRCGYLLGKIAFRAWPYGLVVAVQENGVRAPGDDEPIRRNREELVRLLEAAGVKVELWPSA